MFIIIKSMEYGYIDLLKQDTSPLCACLKTRCHYDLPLQSSYGSYLAIAVSRLLLITQDKN